jgi:hypothetical protein
MNAAWATSLDHLWRSATWPMWLAFATAVVFALIVLVTLLRAEKSLANGALTVISLLAIGVAVATTLRGPDAKVHETAAAPAPVATNAQFASALPALSCLDELAGDMVLAACEKSLFASPESVAAAVSSSAALLDRLRAQGDVAAADKAMTPELSLLRRAVERDRYGLFAYVLQVRDRCMPDSCAAYASLTDHKQVAANMGERFYEGLLTRYAPAWNAPPAIAAAPSSVPGVASLAGLPPSLPTGKPTNAEFPSSSSIPPISIMTDTPVKPAASETKAAPRPAPKKQAAPKEAAPAAPRPQAAAPAAPVQLAPGAPRADN